MLAAETSGSLQRAMAAVVVFSSLSMGGVGLMADISQTWPRIEADTHTAASLVAIVLSWILYVTAILGLVINILSNQI